MPSKTSHQALSDILDNVMLAKSFVEDMSFEEFKDDRRTVYAVTRALEIVSEAVRRLPRETLVRHLNVPWDNIKGAGNVYRHDYEDVLAEMLWATVQNSLDELERVVRTELSS